MKVFLALLLLCSSAHAGESSSWVTELQNNFNIQEPTYFTISCGAGNVAISMKDGTAKFTNCAPDEAARAFWKAVYAMYGTGCPDAK